MDPTQNPNLGVSGVPALAQSLATPPPTPAQQGAPAPASPGTGEVQQFDPQTGAPLSTKIAQNSLIANKMNPGPGNWATNLVAGVQSALAGIGNIGTVPAGAGGLYGIGKVAQYNQEAKLKAQQQKFENDMKQQEMARQQTNSDREYQLRLSENARQQTKDVRDMSEHDLRMKSLNQEVSIKNLELQSAETNFRQQQVDRDEALKRIGAKPQMVAGKPAPDFKDLGDAEKFAQDNGLASGAATNGYRTRITLGSDNQYHLYEVPDEGIKEYTLKDPSGKDVKITTDPLGALNYQEKVSQLKHVSAEANALDAKAALDRVQAGSGTLTDKAIVATDAYNKMKADPEFNNLPKDDEGRINEQSKEYKTLDDKYGVSKAYGEANLGYHTASGEAYIRTLSPSLGNSIRAIGEGREDASLAMPRGKEKKLYVDALNQAYPGFDESEQKNYFSARQKFTTGAQGTAVNSGMVAFHHLRELQQLNTPQSRIPGTPDYVAYQNKMDTVAGELGAFYGTTTIPALEELKSSLNNPTFREKAIQTQATSMTDKMNEYANQWNGAVPKYLQKAGVHPVMPGYDATAINARDQIVGTKPKTAAPAATTQPPPAGVAHDVIVNGVKVGVTTDGGKTMTKVPPPAATNPSQMATQ